MEYRYLTPEIMIPKVWPIHAEMSYFIAVCRQIIKISLQRRVIFQVGATATEVTWSKTTPNYTFTKIEKCSDPDAIYVIFMWPEKIEVSEQKDSIQWTEPAEQTMSSSLMSRFPIHKISVFGSGGRTYLVVRPNTMGVLNLMGVTGSKALNSMVKSTYKLPKIKANSKFSSAYERDVEIVYVDSTHYYPELINIFRKIILKMCLVTLSVCFLFTVFSQHWFASETD